MERISRESPEDYWPVMETLTAFVRRARWKAPNEDASESLLGSDEAPGRQPGDGRMPTDIAAVLSVIRRRDEANHEREKRHGMVV